VEGIIAARLTSYDLADKHGMMDHAEIQLLQKCALMLHEDPIVVNIGAGLGTSVAAILEVRPSAFVFSVDKSPQPEERANIAGCGLDFTRCVRVLGLSWEVGINFPITVDLLFVDGSHEESSVRKDIAAWLPKVADDGVVLFHDYHHPKAPGVTKVVDAAMADYTVIGMERFLIAYDNRR
jgi:precorrin-6B methylase 2